jgi:hypothetical protein
MATKTGLVNGLFLESGVKRAGVGQKIRINDGFLGNSLQQSIHFDAERLNRPGV